MRRRTNDERQVGVRQPVAVQAPAAKAERGQVDKHEQRGRPQVLDHGPGHAPLLDLLDAALLRLGHLRAARDLRAARGAPGVRRSECTRD